MNVLSYNYKLAILQYHPLSSQFCQQQQKKVVVKIKWVAEQLRGYLTGASLLQWELEPKKNKPEVY